MIHKKKNPKDSFVSMTELVLPNDTNANARGMHHRSHLRRCRGELGDYAGRRIGGSALVHDADLADFAHEADAGSTGVEHHRRDRCVGTDRAGPAQRLGHPLGGDLARGRGQVGSHGGEGSDAPQAR